MLNFFLLGIKTIYKSNLHAKKCAWISETNHVELKQVINPVNILKTNDKKHVFLRPYEPLELSWLNIKATAELHCGERCQKVWLKYENKCEINQKKSTESSFLYISTIYKYFCSSQLCWHYCFADYTKILRL